MNYYLFLPFALGVTVVIQGTLNRSIGAMWGLATAVMINATVFFLLSLGFYLVAKYSPHLLPEFLRVRPAAAEFKWYYLIPGICGFMLVLGLPWAIQHLGASLSLILLISAQIIASLIWDAYISSNPVNFYRLSGAFLCFIGALIVSRN